MRFTRTYILRLSFLTSVLGLLSLASPASVACPPMEEIKVTVVAILATDKDNEICPTLADLAQQVRKKRPQLTGFRQASQTCKVLTVGKEEIFELLEKQIADVTVCRGANDKNRVCLKVRAPEVGEITYTTACSKFFPIVTGFQTKKNETLIIAIRVETCKEKK